MSKAFSDTSQQLDTSTLLSFKRTALSQERTLMSWIRTATSLITFGFTIYKFFQEAQRDRHHAGWITPRAVGMIMIGFGMMGLLFAQIQHLRDYRDLRRNAPGIPRSIASFLGMGVLAFGILLFFIALLQQ